ncbi:hypothetical protein C8J57DRAFT_1323734 [Mycena rebaudengoi]|nr:hypothetical protein C8J57DRAFT_1323734 [Mycena rebaudengoi]
MHRRRAPHVAEDTYDPSSRSRLLAGTPSPVDDCSMSDIFDSFALLAIVTKLHALTDRLSQCLDALLTLRVPSPILPTCKKKVLRVGLDCTNGGRRAPTRVFLSSKPPTGTCSPLNSVRNRRRWNCKRRGKEGGALCHRVLVALCFLLPTCAAWSITVGPRGEQPIQCSNISFEILGTDGIPPYKLILVPGTISPTSRINAYSTNDSRRITLSLPYEKSTTITAIARDSAGAASVSKPFIVRGGPSKDCLSPPMEQPTFQFHLSAPVPTVGIPSRIWWDPNETSGVPKFFGFIPAPSDYIPSSFYSKTPSYGTYFDLETGIISDIAGQGRGYGWIPSIAPDSDVIVVGSDSRGLIAGTLLKTHVESGTQLCVFPMSGQYELLQRILFYVLLFFAIIFTHSSFVVSLIVAGVLAFVFLDAINAILITPSSTFDYDAVGAYQILLVTSSFCAPFVVSMRENFYKYRGKPEEKRSPISRRFPEAASSSSRKSRLPGELNSRTIHGPGARRTLALLFCSGMISAVGLVCALATIRSFPHKDFSPACSPTNITGASRETPLTVPVNLSRCITYCSTVAETYRAPGTALVRPAKDIAYIRDYVLSASTVYLLLSVPISCWCLALFFRARDPRSARVVSRLSFAFGLVGFFVTIAAGETLLNGPWVPPADPPRSIVQWVPLVAAGAAIVYECVWLGLEHFSQNPWAGLHQNRVTP